MHLLLASVLLSLTTAGPIVTNFVEDEPTQAALCKWTLKPSAWIPCTPGFEVKYVDLKTCPCKFSIQVNATNQAFTDVRARLRDPESGIIVPFPDGAEIPTDGWEGIGMASLPCNARFLIEIQAQTPGGSWLVVCTGLVSCSSACPQEEGEQGMLVPITEPSPEPEGSYFEPLENAEPIAVSGPCSWTMKPRRLFPIEDGYEMRVTAPANCPCHFTVEAKCNNGDEIESLYVIVQNIEDPSIIRRIPGGVHCPTGEEWTVVCGPVPVDCGDWKFLLFRSYLDDDNDIQDEWLGGWYGRCNGECEQ